MINMLLITFDGFCYMFTGKHFIRDHVELVPALFAELILELLLISFLVPAIVGG